MWHKNSERDPHAAQQPWRQHHTWCNEVHLCLPPPLLPGSRLQALQSLCKRTCLCIPPPVLLGSHLQALHSPHFCKHSLSMLQCPQSSLPHPHNFPTYYIMSEKLIGYHDAL